MLHRSAIRGIQAIAGAFTVAQRQRRPRIRETSFADRRSAAGSRSGRSIGTRNVPPPAADPLFRPAAGNRQDPADPTRRSGRQQRARSSASTPPAAPVAALSGAAAGALPSHHFAIPVSAIPVSSGLPNASIRAANTIANWINSSSVAPWPMGEEYVARIVASALSTSAGSTVS